MSRVTDAFARWSRNAGGEKTMDEQQSGLENNEAQSATAEAQAYATPGEGDGAGVEAPGFAGASGVSGAPGAEIEALQAELSAAQGERDALRERLVRLQAEFDNARKREAREKQDARDYALQSAVEPFLGVMDNFGLALKSGGSAEQLRAGVDLIVKQMEEALRGLNVQPVEAVGAPFDPRFHEALGSVETLEHPDHTVLEEIRRGYKLRDKLLRPALVRIAINPAQKSE